MTAQNATGLATLAINGGSSTIKFAIYEKDVSPNRSLYGKIDRIGLSNPTLDFINSSTNKTQSQALEVKTHRDATKFLIEWLDEKTGLHTLAVIGHRVVHGMRRTEPALVTPALLEELRRIAPCAPQHLPCEIELVEAFRARLPDLPQVVCFDTGFHATMPRVAKLLSIPRRLDEKGIQRYGFHGLSYEFVMQELARIGDPTAVHGCVIVAHLGNGASLVAVRDGKSIDTTMGFTPAAGLTMSTRSGDLDPGIIGYLARTEQMSVAHFDQMVNHHSGLLGVSETSSDVRDLIAKEADDIRAAEALELFCYQTKKAIGSFVAALGGLQTLVFTGGIGENAATIRYRICEGLNYLGIRIDEARNENNAGVISAAGMHVTIRVIRTDEEQMIARAANRMLGGNNLQS